MNFGLQFEKNNKRMKIFWLDCLQRDFAVGLHLRLVPKEAHQLQQLASTNPGFPTPYLFHRINQFNRFQNDFFPQFY